MSSPSLLPQRIFETPLVDDRGLVMRPLWTRFFQTISTPAKVPQLINSTHAKRLTTLAANYAEGSLFYESDRTSYYIARSGSWLWYAGFMEGQQADFAALAALGTNDAGFLFWVTDFRHLLRWDGTQWSWAPGEQGSDFIVQFVSGPLASDGSTLAGWQVCDGSTVQMLNSDGSLSSVTVPNTAGFWYRQ